MQWTAFAERKSGSTPRFSAGVGRLLPWIEQSAGLSGLETGAISTDVCICDHLLDPFDHFCFSRFNMLKLHANTYPKNFPKF